MKKLAVAMLLVAGLTLSGCGSNSSKSGNINGNWTAMLTDTNGTQVFSFTTVLVDMGDGNLNVTKFAFSSSSPCFISGETVNGTFSLTGDFNGNVTGKFGFKVQSGLPVGDTLTLTGTANGNTISGSWSLTGGTGCTGSGNFTMTKS